MKEKKFERLNKEAIVYDLMKEGKTVGEISKETGDSRGKIDRIIRKLKLYESIAPLEEYFAMSCDIYTLIEKCGGKAEAQLPVVMSALWRGGITKRGKLKQMSMAKFEEFCNDSKTMHRAGKACINALVEYKELLKKTKLGK